MTYRAPVADIAFALQVAGLDRNIAEGLHGELSDDLVKAVLEEAGRFASEELAPGNHQGDVTGSRLSDGRVITPEGWPDLYRRWCEAGWNGVMAPEEIGGQGLPVALWAATSEMWASANMAFSLAPMLTQGAIEALHVHGSETLKRLYLEKIVSGEWTGTMNLTEPQAGSDLAALRTRAKRAGDGSYRITGQKIFITFGEHDLAGNIIHMVLARLPDAPQGTRGISLFLVPKILVNEDGSLGAANDLRCHSIEHKMGIHGSPTCTMVYGDHGGATGFLVGEENKGLACMFTMMNNARLGVGLQGVAIAEAARQKALRYAHERTQGRLPSDPDMVPIVSHPDVKHMLMAMRAWTAAARAICYRTATALDRAHLAGSEAERRTAQELANLLTPVAKAFSTDIGTEVASLGVQVHGGMGFIEETGAAQFYRDARIAQIYEGTNGIQAIDLVGRKLPQSGGRCVRDFIDSLKASVDEIRAANAPGFGRAGERLDAAVTALGTATEWMLAAERMDEERLVGATAYLRLFGLAAGGCALGQGALAAGRGEGGGAAHLAIARFFAEHLAVGAAGLAVAITNGAAAVTGAGADAALTDI
ncbi:acyl-CoA dehydrogenase [Agaricicola taiwanensis]|uniref:3-methylmercaptopropionyl-CoA dehydrogenase n=1 Tax=Agaricicola taiwanensis TaxID=591372 RepID=A0A8J2VLA5_9RHOB|nr:acyl-CoA dehydrogenase [Agaricicola taiwanensis]GGE35728.1 acyl-CoA dehydrogenase [Agaricicola taiwanensis]